MVPLISNNRLIYILSNLLVIPATLIPFIDLVSNISFLIAFVLLVKNNILQSLGLIVIFIFKNNSNYRFNLLLNHKGVEVSKSDYECVYLYAWCTLLRYALIGLAAYQIILIFD